VFTREPLSRFVSGYYEDLKRLGTRWGHWDPVKAKARGVDLDGMEWVRMHRDLKGSQGTFPV
jgi:hypothetical protein